MKIIFTFFIVTFLSIGCFSQETDSLKIMEKNIKGMWISHDMSSPHRDSLYFGNNGTFYVAQYHSSPNDTIKGYARQVGRWILYSDSGSIVLKVNCASMEYPGNFKFYEMKLLTDRPFFFLGEIWYKLE